MATDDHELVFLLSLDGSEFRFDNGYFVKIAVKQAATSAARPHGIKYSLTLHDDSGSRVYGIDNAHGVKGRIEFDHRHVHGANKVIGYQFTGCAQLLADFYVEVERILDEKGRPYDL